MDSNPHILARRKAAMRRFDSSALQIPKVATLISLRIEQHRAAIERVVFPFLRGAFIAAVLLTAYGVVNRNVQAASAASDQATAVKLSKQAAYIKELEKTLAKCLTRGDNAVVIGDEIGFCGLTMTGVKTK